MSRLNIVFCMVGLGLFGLVCYIAGYQAGYKGNLYTETETRKARTAEEESERLKAEQIERAKSDPSAYP